MEQCVVMMQMQMRLGALPWEVMSVPVVQVVSVRMAVRCRCVRMLVVVTFGEMYPDANTHEKGAYAKCNRQWFMQGHDCNCRADERRC